MLTNESGQVLESAVLFRLTTVLQRPQCQMSCSTLKRGLPGTPNMRCSIFCSTRFRMTDQSTPRDLSNATRLIQRCITVILSPNGPWRDRNPEEQRDQADTRSLCSCEHHFVGGLREHAPAV